MGIMARPEAMPFTKQDLFRVSHKTGSFRDSLERQLPARRRICVGKREHSPLYPTCLRLRGPGRIFARPRQVATNAGRFAGVLLREIAAVSKRWTKVTRLRKGRGEDAENTDRKRSRQQKLLHVSFSIGERLGCTHGGEKKHGASLSWMLCCTREFQDVRGDYFRRDASLSQRCNRFVSI